jgi:hypothetical protein
LQNFTTLGRTLQLRKLSLSKCDLLDEWLPRIAQVESLEDLSIGKNPLLTDKGIKALVEGLPHLKKLDISGCPMITDEGIFIVAKGMTTLNTLNLASCSVSDREIMRISGHCSQLTALDLDECQQLTDASLLEIPSFPKLTHLSIRFCEGFTDGAIRDLQSRLPALVITQLKATPLQAHSFNLP